jgi:hypothetical protein
MSNVVELKPQTQSTLTKFKVTALVDGYYVALEFEGDIHRLRAAIDGLKKIGATPTEQKDVKAPSGKPKCPVHHSPMKESRNPGSFYCPRKDEYGEYCYQKV